MPEGNVVVVFGAASVAWVNDDRRNADLSTARGPELQIQLALFKRPGGKLRAGILAYKGSCADFDC